MANTSTNPPTLGNPVGLRIIVVAAVVLVLVTIFVLMRLWGRYRYKTLGSATKATFGEPRYWILVSDLTITLSFANAVVLSAVQFNAVKWGQGLHSSELSAPQLHSAMEMFYVYQVLYKFGCGIAKMASVFLLLAISTPQMHAFNLFCKLFALYIGLYSVATSLAAAFQCGTSFESNWKKAVDQSHCFNLPPFWYAHAAINLLATFMMAFLPWWLFAYITYKRKHIIASIMTALALAETALGAVRLYGLFRAASNSTDLTYSSSTGFIVSQLEVDFACIAACIPTVLKMMEEVWKKFNVHVLGHTASDSNTRSYSKTAATNDVHLTDLKSIDRGLKPFGPYTNFDEDEIVSLDGQEGIIKRKSRTIQIKTEVSVSIDDGAGCAATQGGFYHHDGQESTRQGGNGFSANAFAQ